jgi:ParB-like chromosome segregation protein Spo0J
MDGGDVARATELVPIERLSPSEWNPRRVHGRPFRALVDSIRKDPGFLWDRPILARADGSIYAGEQRYHAAKHLGWQAVPARLEDVSDALAKERALRDNAHAGEWEGKKLSEVVAELEIAGVEIEGLSLDDKAMAAMLKASADEAGRGDREEAELEISPELFERHDYLLFYFDNQMDWQVATAALGVGKVESAPVSTRTLRRTGLGRVLPAAKLLEVLARD